MNTALKAAPTRKVTIELIALDIKTCERCVGSLTNIQRAISLLANALKVTNVKVSVTQRVIASEEQALQYQLISSPTIRVNGKDIVLETDESHCDACSDLSGCEEGVNCRVWYYQGKEYTEAPVGLIVEAILSEIYRESAATVKAVSTYAGVPENLKQFFDSQRERSIEPKSACCSAKEQASCCEAEAKSECCGTATAAPSTCGCR